MQASETSFAASSWGSIRSRIMLESFAKLQKGPKVSLYQSTEIKSQFIVAIEQQIGATIVAGIK